MPSGDTPLTITGNLTADPELRYTATGIAVAAFTVAASRRVYDQESGQWKDGTPCSCAARPGGSWPSTSPSPSPRAPGSW